MHKRFQELAVMAATGQITHEEREALQEHTASCAECRAFAGDLALLKARVAPVVAGRQAQSADPPAGIRERFLERASAAGMRIEAGPPLHAEMAAVPRRPVAPVRRSGSGARIVQMAAACLLCGAGGYFLAAPKPALPAITLHAVAVPWQIPQPPLVMSPSTQESALAGKIEEMTRERAELQERLATVSGELSRARAESGNLSRDLAAASDRAASSARFEQQFRAEALRVQNAEDHIRQLQTELNGERERRAHLDLAGPPAPSVASLSDRIAGLEAQLERERANRVDHNDFAQLVSARNLHIVDVYDTASNGRRQRAFGRVFYVEGRSLVFYAYDLADQARGNTTVAFHVWGEEARVKSTTYTLGILKGDGASQSRWVLTFDDPKVLNRINAIYVTAEATPVPGREPRGRKILYAFLGTPNHP